jgi:hypothetical protein
MTPCEHDWDRPEPEFDPVAARGLDVSEIRKRWPRVTRKCRRCGVREIAYASIDHYIMGDW